MGVTTYWFEDDGAIPNSPLPVLVYGGVGGAMDAAGCERMFARNGWLNSWRDGIFRFHHFHSISHEVLGIVRGSATVVLGGPSGRRLEIGRGDVIVLPAGTGHCNVGSSADLLVVGAYPEGMAYDLRRGDPAEHEEAVACIQAVPLPRTDPVEGEPGPLRRHWVGRG